MKIKLLTICFAAVSVFVVNAMDLDALMEELQDLAAIVGVRSLADFANLPDLRVKRLNSNL